MALPTSDAEFLADRCIEHEVIAENSMTCVVIRNWPLPPGYDRGHSDLLLRLPAGYPDVAPDMWWFSPPAQLANGQPIQATNATEQHLGRSWQRWSRHFQPGQWQSGIDGLESFLALIRREVDRGAMESAA